jgi:hypothetical protein
VITEPATLFRGFFRASISYNYTSVKHLFNNMHQRGIISGAAAARSSSLVFLADYGLTDRMEINLWVPYMMNSNEHVLILDDPASSQTTYTGNVRGFGLGDMALGISAQVLKEQEHLPSVTVATYMELPTGRKNPANENAYLEFDEATGSGEFSLGFDAQFRKIVYPYSFEFTSGFEWKTGGQKIHFPGEKQKSFKSGNVVYAIAGINFHLNDWICITNDVNYTYIGKYTLEDSLAEHPSMVFSWTPNIHFQIKKIRIAQGILIPIVGRNYGADPGYIFMFQYIF